MRKIVILAAFAAVAGATTVQAQNGPPPGGRRGGPGGPGMMMDRMLLKDITLTDAQKSQLDKLREAEREKMQAEGGRGRGGADFEAIREAREKGDTATVKRLMDAQRAKMEERRDVQVAAIRAILSADQLTQFDANVAEMKKRAADGPGARGRRGGPPPQD